MRTCAIAFGLFAGSPLVSQTSWSIQYDVNPPPYRQEAVMACHDATGKMVLFSGLSPTGVYLPDAWSLQGNVWTQLPGPLPPARMASQLVYDSARQRLVLFVDKPAAHRYIPF